MTAIRSPWKIVYGSPNRVAHAPRIIDRDGNPVVAFGNQIRHQGQTMVMHRANLIATAPDLLEAAQAAYDVIIKLDVKNDPQALEALEMLCTSINKTKGID